MLTWCGDQVTNNVPHSRKDFYRILTEPEHNMIKQQVAMMATEGVDFHFTEDAIQEIAAVAEEVNRCVDRQQT